MALRGIIHQQLVRFIHDPGNSFDTELGKAPRKSIYCYTELGKAPGNSIDTVFPRDVAIKRRRDGGSIPI